MKLKNPAYELNSATNLSLLASTAVLVRYSSSQSLVHRIKQVVSALRFCRADAMVKKVCQTSILF